jgi:hypothetical protein
MKQIVVLALVVVGCHRSNPNPTAPGTTVLAWELAQSDRETIRSAKLSESTSKDLDYVAHPTDDTTVKVAIHLETATTVFSEAGEEVNHRAPVKLSVKLVDGADFTLGNGTCMGPHYKLAAPGAAPRDMILHCIVKAKKPSYDVSFTIYAYGDGTIDDGRPTTIKVH